MGSNHLMTNHIGQTPGPSVKRDTTPEVKTASTPGFDATQSTIHKCNLCGRMFVTNHKLNEHKETVHINDSNDLIGETNETISDVSFESIDDDKPTLVWVKIATMFWPEKVIKQKEGNGELTYIELFDESRTKKTVEHIKMKPFEKLPKVLTKRSKAWKAAYACAVAILEIE